MCCKKHFFTPSHLFPTNLTISFPSLLFYPLPFYSPAPPSYAPLPSHISISVSRPSHASLPMPLLSSAAATKTGRCAAITLIDCDFFIYMTSARQSWEPTACFLHPAPRLWSARDLAPVGFRRGVSREERWRKTKGLWHWMILGGGWKGLMDVGVLRSQTHGSG